MMKCNRKSKLNDSDGFTLIEVALAMLVLGIGMLSLMAVFPAGLKAGRNSANDMAAIEFSDAVFNDYEWKMADPLGLSLTDYTASDKLIATSGAHYNASASLEDNDSWISIYQDTPSGSFDAYKVKLKVDDIAGSGNLRRVTLSFAKPGSTDAYQVFTRYFTFY